MIYTWFHKKHNKFNKKPARKFTYKTPKFTKDDLKPGLINCVV